MAPLIAAGPGGGLEGSKTARKRSGPAAGWRRDAQAGRTGPRLPPSTVAGKRRCRAERAGVLGWVRASLGHCARLGRGLSRGGAAAGRGLARDPRRGGRGGAWRLRVAAECLRQTQPPRLFGARPSTCCPRPARGAAVMRLALLWALGLLGAGSPLPFPALPDTSECRAGSRPGEDWKEAQGSREIIEVLESEGDPGSPQPERSRPWSAVLG